MQSLSIPCRGRMFLDLIETYKNNNPEGWAELHRKG